jgi:hypothetical protein
MQENNLKRNVSQIYLTLVPILTIVFGLAVGYVSYKIYLPIWILNVFLMIVATWVLSGHAIRTNDVEKKHLVICAIFLITPWMLISMFSGLGAPPYDKAAEWVASATEQQVRYYFLLAVGVLIAFGFAILREKIKKTKGDFYSLLGSVAIQVAIPIFLIDMTFYGFYLAELYRNMAASNIEKTPEWVLAIAKQFHFVNMIVAALVYVATAAFAAALKKAEWFNPTACNIYILISLLLFLLDVLPPSFPEPFATLNLVVSIPAIPFLMPYFMAVNLLRRVGN